MNYLGDFLQREASLIIEIFECFLGKVKWFSMAKLASSGNVKRLHPIKDCGMAAAEELCYCTRRQPPFPVEVLELASTNLNCIVSRHKPV